jgi:hypothetical protein
MLYPNLYVWFIFFAAMDIMMTWVVLWWGGEEANAVANNILRRYGLPGFVGYKFILVALVIFLCEITGRLKPHSGKRLALVAVGLTCVPVAWAFFQLFTYPVSHLLH